MSEYERQYEDGSDPRVLDIINIPVLGPQPENYQTENWLLDPTYYWEKTGAFSPRDLPKLLDLIAPLWIDGQSTFHGRNDRITLRNRQTSVSDSLRLIHVKWLNACGSSVPEKPLVIPSGASRGNSPTRAGEYRLWVTDVALNTSGPYLAKPDGAYSIGECYAHYQPLGNHMIGAFYKLIAAIIRGRIVRMP